jgi:hypothetical protein
MKYVHEGTEDSSIDIMEQLASVNVMVVAA